jgi:DNA-directed RNA polymerase specialized sigma24 family protein
MARGASNAVGRRASTVAHAPRRAVTLLFYYWQQSVREVAAQVGISTAAVKVHLHTARKQYCCCAGT